MATDISSMQRNLTIVDRIDLGAFFMMTIAHVVSLVAALVLAGLVVLGVVTNLAILGAAAVALGTKIYLVCASWISGKGNR